MKSDATIIVPECETDTRSPFLKRCRELDVSVVTTDNEGQIRFAEPKSGGSIDAEVIASPLFTRTLCGHVHRWAARKHEPAEPLWPGCWAVPIPIDRRRQRCGYHVVVLLTPEMIESEQFLAVCESRGLNVEAARSQLEACATHEPQDIRHWATMLKWMHDDLEKLDRSSRDIDDLTNQLGVSYEELSLVYKLSARMSLTHEPTAFLEDALHELQQVIGLRWSAIRLSDSEHRLQSIRGRLFHTRSLPCEEPRLDAVGGALFDAARADPTAASLQTPASLNIRDVGPPDEPILVIPIQREKQILAVFFGGDKIDGGALSNIDVELAMAASQNIALFLENGMLYGDMEDIFMGTLHALVASIDAKDTYTFGHSERVAWVSGEIAKAAGLDELTVERVYLSALVHDIGKIGVPEYVLTKPGRLTPAEFEMIKAHPELGVKILERIPQMDDLIPGVLHHHERYDGAGYPHGLAGKDIPLFGRIIGLADAFDAMSSSRTYRNALSVEDVFDEIGRCSGTQFDPELALAFAKNVDMSHYYLMLADHQQRRSPLRQVMRHSA